jgi:hypothetical protein
MKTMITLKTLAVTALAAAGALGTGLAQARSDVHWSVSIGIPAPVYLEPAPVVYMPRPVYQVQPVPVYGGYQRDYRYPTRWDRDADGVPDRYERPRGRHWDRDRDGVPNRHDRRPDDPWRR